jgi:replicative DNA helicase
MEAYNDTYEKVILTYMLDNPRAILNIKEEDFFCEENRAAFKKIKKGARNRVMLKEQLKKDGFDSMVDKISEPLPSSFDIEPFIDSLLKMSGYRKTLDVLKAAEADPDKYDPETIRKAILNIRGYSKARTLKELFTPEVIDAMADRTVLTTGFAQLDAHFTFTKGQMLIIAGETSRGKTQAAMNIAKHVAEQGGKILFFSLEMSAELLLGRFVAMTLDYPIYRCFGSDTEFRMFAKKMLATESWIDNIYIDEKSQELVEILGSINEVRPDLVIIDYAQLVKVDGHGGDEKVVAEIAQTLRLVAHEQRVILVSQLARATESNSKNPLARLKGSGALEYSASAILFIDKDERTGVMNYSLEKNTTALGNGVGMKVNISNSNGRFEEIP